LPFLIEPLGILVWQNQALSKPSRASLRPGERTSASTGTYLAARSKAVKVGLIVVYPTGRSAGARLRAVRHEREDGSRLSSVPGRARGTAFVPNASSYVSRSSRDLDAWDTWDAPGRIYTNYLSAGGRKVAGSNPVAPIHSPIPQADALT
jgi:hypothetical protein